MTTLTTADAETSTDIVTDFQTGIDLGGEARHRIAMRILELVAEFANDADVVERAAAGDLDRGEDELPHHAIERAIRSLAKDAEGVALARTAGADAGTDVVTDVVSGVLAGEYLLDDYLRIVAVEQHYAFDEEMTAGEEKDHLQLLDFKAQEAAEMAVARERRRREGLRVCRCGNDYDRHRRNLSRESWVPVDQAVNHRFEPVESQVCSAVSVDVLRDGIAAWAVAQDLSLDDGGLDEAQRLLAEIKAGAKGRVTRVEDAFVAVAATLSW